MIVYCFEFVEQLLGDAQLLVYDFDCDVGVVGDFEGRVGVEEQREVFDP